MSPVSEDDLRLIRKRKAEPTDLADFERRRRELVARSQALSRAGES